VDEAQPDQADTPPSWRDETRYWLRSIVLAVAVLVLAGLSIWDARRVPNRPVPPTVLTATPPAGATVSASDPALRDVLERLRLALGRRDARALANLVDQTGLVAADYGGGLPDSGYVVSDPLRLCQEVLSGSQVTILGWRSDARGRVVVLTDGWARRPLKLGAGSALEMTPTSALGLTSRAGAWYWHWVMPDGNGTLVQQARSLPWQDGAQLNRG
jgi:hypothetical protein